MSVTNWNGMGWPEWEQELEKAWNESRSRFSTTWEDLPHHDRVSIWRILMDQQEEMRS